MPSIDRRPQILVAGLGRCGTTLTMHMLAAAGVPCVGEAPAYEPGELLNPLARGWLDAQAGRALKVLDPHRNPLPARWEGSPRARTIWLDRDPTQQARSQAKFASLMLDAPYPPRAQLRRWAVTLKQERPLACRALAVTGRPVGLVLKFEDTLHAPNWAAARIAAFLASDFPDLEVEAMASVVRNRSAACAPGLDIERDLTEAAEARRHGAQARTGMQPS